MMQLLTEREIEFLTKFKALIIAYNAEIYCTKAGCIQCVVDVHLNPDWIYPIAFNDCLDETDIDDLFEETRTKTQLIVDKYYTDDEEEAAK